MGTRDPGSIKRLRQPRGQAAQQVEQQVLAMPQDVFHALPEHPQEQHVAQHMQPAGVQNM